MGFGWERPISLISVAIVVPDAIVVDGVVEGDVTA
jgi:cytoskeletal protein CcmA (bactofilin family)